VRSNVARRNRYPLNRLRQSYTYAVDEVAALYEITPDTVFRWIREEGLKRLPHSKKYFVHSTDLRAFLGGLNTRNRKPCKDNEIFCCKCRTQRTPLKHTLTYEQQPNGTIRVRASCPVCETGIYKPVSARKWSEIHPLHPGCNAPIIEPSGVHLLPCKSQTSEGAV